MSSSAGIIASMAKALSAIRPASMNVISRVPGCFTPSWKAESNMGARLLADCARPCNIGASQRGWTDESAAIDAQDLYEEHRGRGRRDDLAARPCTGPSRSRTSLYPDPPADLQRRAIAAPGEGEGADAAERHRCRTGRVRTKPRLSHRHPMVAKRAADCGRHPGGGRSNRRHALLRKPQHQGDAEGSGRGPHLAGR